MRLSTGLLCVSSLIVLAPSAALAAPAYEGWYLGVNAGGGGFTSTENYNPAYHTPYDPYAWAMSGTGLSGGVFAGYNRQIDGLFVLGAEGQINANGATAWYSGDKYAVQTWDGSLRAKFGMPMGNSLLYGLAGVTVSHFDYSGYYSGSSYKGTAFDALGGQLGFGVQTQLTNNIFGRVEVAGTMFGKHTIELSGGPYWDVTPASVSVKGGIGFNFGGTALPGELMSPTPSSMNWTGFYVGAQGGLTGFTSTENYNPTYTTPSDPHYWSFTGHGPSGGLFGGYNYQLNNRFVLGAEANINFNNSRIWYYGDWIDQGWDAGLKVKAGIPFGNTLVYGLAGVVVSQFDYSHYWTSPSPPYSGTTFAALGGQVGLGAQTQFTDSMFGRLELASTDYGEHTIKRNGSPYWDVWPTTLSVKAGVGVNFP